MNDSEEDESMEELRPKKATLDKTTLKTILCIESEGNVDITSMASKIAVTFSIVFK